MNNQFINFSDLIPGDLVLFNDNPDIYPPVFVISKTKEHVTFIQGQRFQKFRFAGWRFSTVGSIIKCQPIKP